MKNNRLDGEKLRQILESRGLAISDLARLCGKNRAVMSQWISGKRNPRRGEIQKIADALRLNISEISDYSDDDFTAIPLSSEEPIPEYRYIYETVMSQLQKRVSESGQVKTAEFIGVSGGYISMLLNNKANISDLKLSAFLKLFPNIKIDFGLQPASPDLREYLHSLIDLIDQPQMLSLKPILELMAGKTTMEGINQKTTTKRGVRKMGYMEEINNAAKEIEVTVKSLQGTEDNSCKCCGSWLAHWTQHTGFTPSWCRGCEAKLSAKDLVGGHVFKVNDTDHKWYVVPLCKACNNSAPFEFNVKLKDLIWVDKCEKKSNLVYSILKNKASERK